MQRDFGKVACRARGRTGEDHVLHPAAAHCGGAVFAHHPAQRFEQVRLAAPVGPDNPCQTIRNDEICWVDEAFEAGQSEFGETHARPLNVILLGAQCDGLPWDLSTQAGAKDHRMLDNSATYPQDIAPRCPKTRQRAVAGQRRSVANSLDRPCDSGASGPCMVCPVRAKRSGMKWECRDGRPNQGPKAAAAPATVSGERPAYVTEHPLGKTQARSDPRARRPAVRNDNPVPSGVTADRRLTPQATVLHDAAHDQRHAMAFPCH